jgi:hypothetical protein
MRGSLLSIGQIYMYSQYAYAWLLLDYLQFVTLCVKLRRKISHVELSTSFAQLMSEVGLVDESLTNQRLRHA